MAKHTLAPERPQAVTVPSSDNPEISKDRHRATSFYSKERAASPRRSKRNKVSGARPLAEETTTSRNTTTTTITTTQNLERSSSAFSTTGATTTEADPSPRRKPKRKPIANQKLKTAISSAPTAPHKRHRSRGAASTPTMNPTKLLLSHARRAVALSIDKISIMDVILDGGARSPPIASSSTRIRSRPRPLQEVAHLYRQRLPRMPDTRSYLFNDPTGLDAYWRDQRAFLDGIGAFYGDGGEEWNGLMTLANVSAERSTAAWSDDSATSTSACSSDVLLRDEDVQIIDVDAEL